MTDFSKFKFNIGDTVAIVPKRYPSDPDTFVIARRWLAPNGWQEYYVSSAGITGFPAESLVLVKKAETVIPDPPEKKPTFAFSSGGKTTVFELTPDNIAGTLSSVLNK